MNLTESVGYLAAALVLAAFCMRNITALRRLAIASNLAFIAYGALAGLGPVLFLHLLLLPINLVRLRAATLGRAPRASSCRRHEDRPRARSR